MYCTVPVTPKIVTLPSSCIVSRITILPPGSEALPDILRLLMTSHLRIYHTMQIFYTMQVFIVCLGSRARKPDATMHAGPVKLATLREEGHLGMGGTPRT